MNAFPAISNRLRNQSENLPYIPPNKISSAIEEPTPASATSTDLLGQRRVQSAVQKIAILAACRQISCFVLLVQMRHDLVRVHVEHIRPEKRVKRKTLSRLRREQYHRRQDPSLLIATRQSMMEARSCRSRTACTLTSNRLQLCQGRSARSFACKPRSRI